MLPALVQVIPGQNYCLNLLFANGEKKIFDVKPYLNTGIFKELTASGMLEAVKISFVAIAWANEADIDPETLCLGSLEESKNDQLDSRRIPGKWKSETGRVNCQKNHSTSNWKIVKFLNFPICLHPMAMESTIGLLQKK